MGSAPLVLVAAALAGVTTLAAGVLWLRGLGRGMGMAPEALTVVAGLVLAGLGLGAAVAARTAPSSERPARAGGLCLLLAGVLVALSPLYLQIVPGLHVGLLDLLGLPGAGGPLPLILLAAPLVLPTTWLLGMAFPYLVRTRVRDLRRAASRTGWVYAANTTGALLGVVGAMILLPRAGEATALHLAGACALAAALVLLLGDRPLPHGSGPPQSAEMGRSLGAGPVGPALFASGAAVLVAQFAWMRLLQPLVGPQLWSMAFLLGPVLVGVALGAVVVGRLADRVQRAGLLLAAVMVVAGVLTILSLPLAGGLPLRLVRDAAESGGHRALRLAWGLLLVTGPAMLAFGAALPLAVRVRADRSGSSAAAAGRIYAWNTLGALCGGVLAGFLLLPRLGAERSLVVAGALSIVAATLLRLRTAGGTRVVPAALHLLPLAVLLWPGWLGGLLRSGPEITGIIAAHEPAPVGLVLEDREDLRLYATWFAGQRASAPDDATGAVLPTFEGRAGRVSLIEEPNGYVGIRRGAVREALFHPDRPDRPRAPETALALLPGLLRPTSESERALVIGHGAGWTAEAGLAVGAHRLVVAEVDAAVLDAARAYRGLERLPAEAGARSTVVECDGRLMLRRAAAGEPDERYAWIASKPSQVRSGGAAHLLTQEAYEIARAALLDDGVMAQWLNVLDLTPELLRNALGAFHAVFDEVWVFRFPGDLILVGFKAAPHLDPAHWETHLGGEGPCARLAAAAGFQKPGELWKHFALDTAGLDRVLGVDPGSLHDDRPQLEFEVAWRRMAAIDGGDAASILDPAFPPDVAAILPDAMLRERWTTHAVLAWLRDGYPQVARVWSRKLRWGSSADGKAAQGLAALRNGALDRAESLLSSAVGLEPKRGDLVARWIDVLRAQLPMQQDADAKLGPIDEIAARYPRDGRVLAAAARAHRSVGRVERSRALFEQAVAAAEPVAPPGTGIQLARLLLSTAVGVKEGNRALGLLARDEATYERIDALDFYVRMTSQMGDEEGAAKLEPALRTLERTRGLAQLRTAAGLLARHEFDDALLEAQACRTTWASHPTAWELEGLVLLAVEAAKRGSAQPDATDLAEIVEAFTEAVVRSKDPKSTQERARRMLRWFGHGSGALEAALALRMP